MSVPPTRPSDPPAASSTRATKPLSNGKAVVIGIYGLPAAGKTHLVNMLKTELCNSGKFTFYEGSQVISSLVPGGLQAFKQLPIDQQTSYRRKAILKIGDECAADCCTGIVTGHFMFWPQGEQHGHAVYTQEDLNTYTHVIYLETPVNIIHRRSLLDQSRVRPVVSKDHLQQWQHEDKTQLRQLCLNHGILFMQVGHTQEWGVKDDLRLLRLVQQMHEFNEQHNLEISNSVLDQALFNTSGESSANDKDKVKTVLVLDADRTLAAEDAGKLFWEKLSRGLTEKEKTDPLKEIFSGPLGHTFNGFWQANLLYKQKDWYSSNNEEDNENPYKDTCRAVAEEITLYPEFATLLRSLRAAGSVRAVVITCGIANIWKEVLRSEDLEHIPVIGGGAIEEYVVTPEVKAALVCRLKYIHKCYVIAFGDSPLDLPMMVQADDAIVVVGREEKRSKTMDAALLGAFKTSNLHARQTLLGNHTSLRLDTTTLPVVDITSPSFNAALVRPPQSIVHATPKKAAQLLATLMRDANISGPLLREAHRRVGSYLALEYLSEMLGLEQYAIPHVQGHQTEGFQLAHESRTVIIALMRGGEPMAFGVSDVFSRAVFVHAEEASKVELKHVNGCKVVLLVDSVVNSGGTALNFIDRVRQLQGSDVMIVVVAGVVQMHAVDQGMPLGRRLVEDGNLRLVALRLSENQFIGKGRTDTGNRLFNTTHLV